MTKKVFIGLSGGVDSALSADLLIKEGYDVEAVFIQNWDGSEEQCTVNQDREDARAVAKHLGIKIHEVNFIKEYKKFVFDSFLDDLEAGLTPNPDIFCNKFVKFDAFYHWALEQGADLVATGHYAQIDKHHRLICGVDPKKDQTYFLYAIDKEILPRLLFPLGQLTKIEVRELARELSLPVSEKKDSTGICFIGPNKFRAFLSQYLPSDPGPIVSKEGVELAQHHGISFYTLGQRQGLNIGGHKLYTDNPWYVVKKDLDKNTIVVSQDKNDPLIYGKTLLCRDLHWLFSVPKAPFKAQARIRHGQEKQECWVYPNSKENKVQVDFLQDQRCMTPGQAIVFYSSEQCLGGGTIC